MNIQYFGHATFLMEIKGTKVLFDPFNLGKSVKEICPEYILISHAHNDHIENALEIASLSQSTIIANFEIANWFKEKGIKKTHGMNIGGAYNFEFGKIKMVPAQHSSVFEDGTFGGNACGFIIVNDEVSFYFAGDTGLTAEMKVISDTHKLDYAFLPIGDNFTMGVEDAIIASNYINCSKIVAMHFDTFPLIKVDKKNAEIAFNNAGKKLILPAKGKSLKL